MADKSSTPVNTKRWARIDATGYVSFHTYKHDAEVCHFGEQGWRVARVQITEICKNRKPHA